jgi:hypothetical protein
LRFVEEEVVDRRLRCVFVKSGVDTDDRDRWRQLLHVNAMVDEVAADLGAVHVRAAHEGLLENGFVWGTLAFGYVGEAVPRISTNRGRPRQKVVIDSATSVWVFRIFEWYAIDELSIAECVRKLNGLNVPLPPKCATGAWTRMAVRTFSSNSAFSTRHSDHRAVLAGVDMPSATQESESSLFLPSDGLVHFRAMHGSVPGGGDAQPHLAAADADDADYHVVANPDVFIAFPR